jgi:hypothetical protein
MIVPDLNANKIKTLNIIRTFALRWWKRHTRREFTHCFFGEHKLQRPPRTLDLTTLHRWDWQFRKGLMDSKEGTADWKAGRDCIARCSNATWWEWQEGSRPHFWRWDDWYRPIIRDGLPPWYKISLPRWQIPQRIEPNPVMHAAMKKKLEKVRRLGYLAPGEVKSLTSFFAVPKGENDIRMVYDGTRSGLNNAMWAPWFAMPTIEGHLRFMGINTYLGDIDVGDMFLNFVLHEDVRKVAGVDLTAYCSEELVREVKKRFIWERWTRCGMGFRSSPYNAIQAIMVAEEKIRGDPKDSTNILHWDTVSLNLPGSHNYMPWLPWVFKMRSSDGQIACDFAIYVDDVRTAGNDWREAKLCSRRVASSLNWLGIQDAPRKRRDPSQTPGPWAGSIIQTENGVLCFSISQERWEKTKLILNWTDNSTTECDKIEFKTLESYRGFLVYVVRTYPMMNPYLKGIHLTLDSWRPWRKEDGWKMTLSEIRLAMDEKGMDEGTYLGCGGKPPKKVKWVPRLLGDIKALKALFATTVPARRLVRPTKGASVVYKFGDASGSGFGSSFYINDRLYYSSGQWNDDYSSESSNYRDLANLGFAMEEAQQRGELRHAEVFVFTDNSTAESAFFKGTSSSKRLFELVLRLQLLEMNGN